MAKYIAIKPFKDKKEHGSNAYEPGDDVSNFSAERLERGIELKVIQEVKAKADAGDGKKDGKDAAAGKKDAGKDAKNAADTGKGKTHKAADAGKTGDAKEVKANENAGNPEDKTGGAPDADAEKAAEKED